MSLQDGDRVMPDDYLAYLRSPRWRQRRKEVLNIADKTCQACRAATATEVHHRTYVRLGNELDRDLIALCSLCHEAITDYFKALWSLQTSRADLCRSLAESSWLLALERQRLEIERQKKIASRLQRGVSP